MILVICPPDGHHGESHSYQILVVVAAGLLIFELMESPVKTVDVCIYDKHPLSFGFTDILG